MLAIDPARNHAAICLERAAHLDDVAQAHRGVAADARLRIGVDHTGCSAEIGAGQRDDAALQLDPVALHGSAGVARSLVSTTYGLICFSIFFSFVGTVLGGIWADQSWGRFWGWDPKENGAAHRALECLILPARWGLFVRERGLMAMAIFGNVTNSLSWFGVNMLGIGLQSSRSASCRRCGRGGPAAALSPDRLGGPRRPARGAGQQPKRTQAAQRKRGQGRRPAADLDPAVLAGRYQPGRDDVADAVERMPAGVEPEAQEPDQEGPRRRARPALCARLFPSEGAPPIRSGR